jgi:hypothetical protein
LLISSAVLRSIFRPPNILDNSFSSLIILKSPGVNSGSNRTRISTSLSLLKSSLSIDPEFTPGLFKIIKLENELSRMFGGRKIDLRTALDISKYYRKEVLNSRKVVYVET